jgi:hypothetical protein
VVLSPANDRVGSVRLQTIHQLFELFSSRDQLRNFLGGITPLRYHAKALNPLYPLSTLLSHTGTMATACKIQGRFISVETEGLLA